MITITDHKQLQPIDHYCADQFKCPEELTETDKSNNRIPNKQFRCGNSAGHEVVSMFHLPYSQKDPQQAT
jgi:hypothetical protein